MAYFTVVILLACLALTIHAYPVFTDTHSEHSQSPKSILLRGTSGPEVLGFEGNSDLYGVGIRLGYYTQALSLWLSNSFVPYEAAFLQTTNTMFMIAILLGMCFLSWREGGCYAVEVYLLFHISCTITRLGTESYSAFSMTHMIVRDAVWCATCFFTIWYWFAGMDRMERTPGGVTNVWFYARGDLYGWIRVFFQVVMPLAAVFRVVRLWCSVHYAFQQRSSDELFDDTLYERLRIELLLELAEDSEGPLEKTESISDSITNTEPKKWRTRRFHKEPSFQADSVTVLDRLDVPRGSHRRWRSLSPNGSKRIHISTSPIITTTSSSASLAKEEQLNLKATTGSSIINTPSSPRALLPSLKAASCYLHAIMTSDAGPLHSHLASCSSPPQRHFLSSLPLFPVIVHYYLTRPQSYIHSHSYFPLIFRFFKTTPPPSPSPSSIAASRSSPRGGIALDTTRPSLTPLQSLILLTHLYSLSSKPAPVLSQPPKAAQKSKLKSLFPPSVLAFIDVFGLYVILVLNTELTLQWNGIRGVQSLSTVGQLLPSVLGIGGLVRVIWGGIWRKRRSKDRMGKTKEMERTGDIEAEVASLWTKLEERMYK